MGAGNEFGIGEVFNYSSATVVCWVQDNDPELYMLGPNKRSPLGVDVDLVSGFHMGPPKATGPWQSPKLDGHYKWIKFANGSVVTIRGGAADLSIEYSLSAQADKELARISKTPIVGGGRYVAARAKLLVHPTYTDEEALKLSGVDMSKVKSSLEFLSSNVNWGSGIQP